MSIFDYKPAAGLKAALDSYLGRTTSQPALRKAKIAPDRPKLATRMRRAHVAHHLRAVPSRYERNTRPRDADNPNLYATPFRADRYTWTRSPRFHTRPAFARYIQYEMKQTLQQAKAGADTLVRVVRHRYLHATKGWREFAVLPAGIARA